MHACMQLHTQLRAHACMQCHTQLWAKVLWSLSCPPTALFFSPPTTYLTTCPPLPTTLSAYLAPPPGPWPGLPPFKP